MLDIIINPFITVLLVLYGLLGGNVFLAIVAFTILVRFALLPLTMKQQRSFKRMQELSPKLKQLQEKYKNDRERLTQEQMALYREHGVNPFAGCLPLLVQLPIFLSLWRAILATLASTPDQLLELQHRIMIGGLDHLVPLKNTFLWMNLALPDPFYILPILVVITTYLQQKLIMPVSSTSSSSGNDAADQAARMSKQMTTFMPLMFGFFALTYSSGLSIYFITSNIVGIIQYAMMGKADFRRLIGKESTKKEEKVVAEMPADEISDAVIEAPAAKPKSATKATAPVREPRTPKEPVEPGSVISATGRQLKPGISERKLTGSAAAASNVASSNGKSTKTPAKSSSRNRPKK